jgi:hypothetical protein
MTVRSVRSIATPIPSIANSVALQADHAGSEVIALVVTERRANPGWADGPMDMDSVERPENVGKMMKEHDSLWLLRGDYTPSCLYKPTYTYIYIHIVYIYIYHIHTCIRTRII